MLIRKKGIRHFYGLKAICIGSTTVCSMVGTVVAVSGAESIIERPPFKTVDKESSEPTENIATQGSLNERFQFSGFFDTGSNLKFSIQDQKSSKPYWVSIGESIEGVKVESWDAEKLGVVLSERGKKEMLVLKEVKTGASTRPMPQMYNPVRSMAPTTYPSPPPSLPKPTQLMEKLRREQARKNKNESR